MEKAYRVEAGLEPAAKSKPRAPSAARKEKTKHDMVRHVMTCFHPWLGWLCYPMLAGAQTRSA